MTPHSVARRASLDALREQYQTLLERMNEAPDVLTIPLAKLSAPVRHLSTVRLIGRQAGLSTLGDLVRHAAYIGHASYDIVPGVTLARIAEWYLANGFSPAHAHEFHLQSAIATSSAPSAESSWDQWEGLLDSCNDLYESIATRSFEGWARNALYEHFARVTSPLKSPVKRVTDSACVDLANRSLVRTAAAILLAEFPLIEDVQDTLQQFGERAGRLACERLGVSKWPQPTLEEMGRREGVTRERIRQLLQPFEKDAPLWKPPLATFSLLQAAIDCAGDVITAIELSLLLHKGEQFSSQEISVIDELTRLGWLRGLEKSEFDGIWLRAGRDQRSARATIQAVRKKANRSIARVGAVNLAAFEEVAGDDGPALALNMSAERGPQKVVDGWAVLSHAQRTLLANRIQRASVVTSSLSMPRLQRMLRRTLRISLPDHVLAEVVLRDINGAHLQNGEVFTWPQHLPECLPRSEKLARRLISEANGVTTLRQLQRGFVAFGMSTAMAGVIYSRSALIEKVATGLVCLIGNMPGAQTVSEARRALKRDSARTLLGKRNTKDGVEIVYKLDKALVTSMMFVLPQNVVAEGDWRLLPDDQTLKARRGYLTGLNGIARRAAESDAKQLTVSFNFADRTVTLLTA